MFKKLSEFQLKFVSQNKFDRICRQCCHLAEVKSFFEKNIPNRDAQIMNWAKSTNLITSLEARMEFVPEAKAHFPIRY